MKKNTWVKLVGGLGSILGAAALLFAKNKNDIYNDLITKGFGKDPDDPDNTLEEFWGRHLEKGFQEGDAERQAIAQKILQTAEQISPSNPIQYLVNLAKAYRMEERGNTGENPELDLARAQYLLKVLTGVHK